MVEVKMVIANEITRGVNPLDLYDLFVNQIAGNMEIFLVFAIMMMFLLAAKMRVPNKTVITLAVIFGLILGAFSESILVLAIFAIAYPLALVISKFIGRV